MEEMNREPDVELRMPISKVPEVDSPLSFVSSICPDNKHIRWQIGINDSHTPTQEVKKIWFIDNDVEDKNSPE